MKQKESYATHKGRLGESYKKKRGSNIIHYQHIRSADREIISEDTFEWLLTGDLEGETASQIIETQAQALETKYHATKTLQ